MHKTFLVKFGFVTLIFSIACPAFAELTHLANPQPGDMIVLNYTSEGAGSYSGGPFLATVTHADNTTDIWKTFCVEADGGEEDFYPGTTYQVWSTDLHVAAATGNYVTDAAKWLYYQSLHDSDALPSYVPDDISSDSYLQEAIWHGVLLSGTNTPLNMPYEGPAVTWYELAAAAVAAGWADADLVRVVNPADLGYSGTGASPKSIIRGRL